MRGTIYTDACVAMGSSELDSEEDVEMCRDGRLQRNVLSKFRVKRLERLKSCSKTGDEAR